MAASVWISTSVALFLAVTSLCCILSLSSINLDKQDQQCNAKPEHNTSVSTYTSNLAIITVMLVGIVAMLFFICGRKYFAIDSSDCQSNRHNLHGKYSLWSIIVAFFIGYCTLGINYFIVGASCLHKWKKCSQHTVTRDNLVTVVFHLVSMAFTGFETIVCWMMKCRNFRSSPMVWHGLAVVQAANIVLWFDSILKESSHRNNDNAHSLEAYFVCKNELPYANLSINATSQSQTLQTLWNACTASSTAGLWFVMSSPFLFPITIEFALLVSETFLSKSIGAQSHSSNENAGAEGAQSVSPTQNSSTENTSAGSIIVIMISVIINIFYVVTAILLFVNYIEDIKDDRQHYDDAFAVVLVVYDSLSIICCVIGIITCCTFSKMQQTHTTFLEYLLLFATSGVLLQSVKRLLTFINIETPGPYLVYYSVEVLNMVQVLFQNVLYYCAKDVKLPTSAGRNASSRFRIAVFKNIMVVMSIINFATWLCESFLLPEMSRSITPFTFEIDPWLVFDNVVIPIKIFFRFNSALLFWCILGSDVSQPGKLVYAEVVHEPRLENSPMGIIWVDQF